MARTVKIGALSPGLNNRLPPSQLAIRLDNNARATYLYGADNVDINAKGYVKRRKGLVGAIEAGFAHSIWGDGEEGYGVVDGALVRLTQSGDGLAAETLDTGFSSQLPVSFCRMPDGDMTFSSAARIGRITKEGELRPLITPTPAVVPVVSAGSGALVEGQYLVAFTAYSVDGESAATPVAQLYVPANGSIQIANAAGLRVYVSGPNGDILSFVGVGLASILTLSAGGARCMTLNLAAMPAGSIVRHYNGKLLVASGNTLYVSEPYYYGLFNPSKGYVPLPAPITVVQCTPGGVFICADKTYRITDFDAGDIAPVLPYGGIPGTGGSYPDDEKVFWMSPRGLVVASDAGVKNVQEAALQLKGGTSGATLYREQDGMKHVIASRNSTEPNIAVAKTFMDAQVVRRGTARLLAPPPPVEPPAPAPFYLTGTPTFGAPTLAGGLRIAPGLFGAIAIGVPLLVGGLAVAAALAGTVALGAPSITGGIGSKPSLTGGPSIGAFTTAGFVSTADHVITGSPTMAGLQVSGGLQAVERLSGSPTPAAFSTSGAARVIESLTGAPTLAPFALSGGLSVPGSGGSFLRYFSADLVPVARGTNIQSMLDSGTKIKLPMSSPAYAAVVPDFVMGSGAKVVGYPGSSYVNKITIQPGANGAELAGVWVSDSGGVYFPPSTVNTANIKVSNFNGPLIGDGSKLTGAQIYSGYLSEAQFQLADLTDNVFMRLTTSGAGLGGHTRHACEITGTGLRNTFVAINALGARSGAIHFKNQVNAAIIGADEETYAGPHLGDHGSVWIENGSNTQVSGLGGGIWNGSDSFQVDNSDMTVLEKSAQNVDPATGGLYFKTVGGNTNLYCVQSPTYAAQMGVSNISTRPAISGPGFPTRYVTPELTQVAATGLPDYTATLQAQLNAGYLLAPAFPVRITTSLKIKLNGTIFEGSGMDVSAIVADGNFPCLVTEIGQSGPDPTTCSFNMFDISFHGGTFAVDLSEHGIQFTGGIWSHFAFVGQSVAAMRVVPGFYAIDNSGGSYGLFQDCQIAVLNIGDTTATGTGYLTYAYMDKWYLYQCTFRRCKPADWTPFRANNLSGFICCTQLGGAAAYFDSHNSYVIDYNNSWSTPINSSASPTISYP